MSVLRDELERYLSVVHEQTLSPKARLALVDAWMMGAAQVVMVLSDLNRSQDAAERVGERLMGIQQEVAQYVEERIERAKIEQNERSKN